MTRKEPDGVAFEYVARGLRVTRVSINSNSVFEMRKHKTTAHESLAIHYNRYSFKGYIANTFLLNEIIIYISFYFFYISCQTL